MYSKFSKLLKKKHLTVYRVSKMSGVSQSVLSEWKKRNEEGRGGNLSVANLKKLSEALEVPITYFFDD